MQEVNKRRVLIFSTAYLPLVGGAEVAIKEITDRLGDFEFDLLTARMQKSLPFYEKIGNVNVYRLGIGAPLVDKLILPIESFLFARHLVNKKGRKYVAFWGVMVTFASIGAYLYNFFTFKKIPVVLTLQEGDSEEHLKYKWFGLINLSWKIALRRTTVLTGISNFLIDRAKKNGYTKESFLVPNGVDLSIFKDQVSEEVKESTIKFLSKKEGDIFLVTTGRLTYKNATDDIILALTKLPKNISLIVIGRGEEGEKLQKLATALGVEERVKFLGFVPYNEIPKYFSVCDLFIRPSRSEGFGNSFIEAMAVKMPVIATPVGGIPDFLTDNETGVFCSPDNPQSIVNAVNLILGDVNLKNYIVKNAFDRVTQRYGWDNIAPKMASVFDKVSN